jgi:hypothetical protein
MKATPMNFGDGSVLQRSLQAAIKYSSLILGICGAELVLAYELPLPGLMGAPVVRAFVDFIALVAPAVHHFDRIAPDPEAISFFLAITIVVALVKAAVFFRWLNVDRIGMYRHLVISPLTDTAPKRGMEFLTDALNDSNIREERFRPMRSRVIWSLSALFMAAALVVTILISGWELVQSPRVSTPEALVRVAQGGLALWFYWAVIRMTFCAFLLAIIASILRDYVSFLVDIASLRRHDHE